MHKLKITLIAFLRHHGTQVCVLHGGLMNLLCRFLRGIYRKDEAILYEQVLPVTNDDELSSLKLPGTHMQIGSGQYCSVQYQACISSRNFIHH